MTLVTRRVKDLQIAIPSATDLETRGSDASHSTLALGDNDISLVTSMSTELTGIA